MFLAGDIKDKVAMEKLALIDDALVLVLPEDEK